MLAWTLLSTLINGMDCQAELVDLSVQVAYSTLRYVGFVLMNYDAGIKSLSN